MSLTYNSWLTETAALCGTTTTSPNFVIEVPNAIDYAELRLFRDLDLITTITTDATQTTPINGRNITVPSAFVVVNSINVITPSGVPPDTGKRNQLVKVSKDYLDYAWPDASVVGVPTLYAIVNQNSYVIGMWSDQAYAIEYTGTQRPTPLSNSNQTTFLSINLPDIFLAATMIHFSGFQKKFGAQADDPRMAVSWESQYKELLTGCDAEELRKRYTGTALFPPPGASKQPTVPAAARQ